jgi:peptidoglycan/LPS O-acetylase OafA/YrhL
MGFYRLILAMLVAISHAGISFYGYNPGVVAVISFFILSGYVMSMLINTYYKKTSAVPSYYLDRTARLLPQFLFYMSIASACIFFFEIDSVFVNKLTVGKWLLNFLIIPQGFFMWWADGAQVMPQTWSLGLEAMFYLVIPWIIILFTKRQIYALAFFSFLVFLTAYFGKINTDNFGYRLLPGTLFMFLVGWSFFQKSSSSKKFRLVIFTLSLVLFINLFVQNSLYQLPYNKEVLLGLLIGMACVAALKERAFSQLDEFFGDLSYGVFLNHFIVVWLMQKFLSIKIFAIQHVLLLLTASTLIALVSFFCIERPALRWRQSIREKMSSRTGK